MSIRILKEESQYETTPIMGVFWVFKSESILPIHAPPKKRGYDGQTQAPGLVPFVTVEVLNREKFFKNKEEAAKPESVGKVKF